MPGQCLCLSALGKIYLIHVGLNTYLTQNSLQQFVWCHAYVCVQFVMVKGTGLSVHMNTVHVRDT